MNQQSSMPRPSEDITDFHIPINEDQSPTVDSARIADGPVPSIEEFTYQIHESEGRHFSSDVVNEPQESVLPRAIDPPQRKRVAKISKYC